MVAFTRCSHMSVTVLTACPAMMTTRLHYQIPISYTWVERANVGRTPCPRTKAPSKSNIRDLSYESQFTPTSTMRINYVPLFNLPCFISNIVTVMIVHTLQCPSDVIDDTHYIPDLTDINVLDKCMSFHLTLGVYPYCHYNHTGLWRKLIKILYCRLNTLFYEARSLPCP